MSHHNLNNRLRATSVTVFGKFSVLSGDRIFVPRPDAPPGSDAATPFMSYKTTFQCAALGDFLPANLRIYSPTGPALPDYTVLDVFARICTPPSSTSMLEAVFAKPFPGDPNSDNYDLAIPDLPHPQVVVLGIVSSNAQTLDDGARAFFVEAQSRVCLSDHVSRIL